MMFRCASTTRSFASAGRCTAEVAANIVTFPFVQLAAELLLSLRQTHARIAQAALRSRDLHPESLRDTSAYPCRLDRVTETSRPPLRALHSRCDSTD